MKICSKCNETKPYAEFQKAKGYKDGYAGQCKLCRYKNSRKWLKSNSENQIKANEATREWYKKDGYEYYAKYREENREEINKKVREVRTGKREPIRPSPMKGRKRPDIQGEKNPNWKGGTTSQRDQAMATLEYRIWRQTVLKRDNFKCVL
jgi:hypothetical protein